MPRAHANTSVHCFYRIMATPRRCSAVPRTFPPFLLWLPCENALSFSLNLIHPTRSNSMRASESMLAFIRLSFLQVHNVHEQEQHYLFSVLLYNGELFKKILKGRYRCRKRRSLGAPWVKNPALSQQWFGLLLCCRFDPLAWEFPHEAPPQKKTTTEKKSFPLRIY